MIKSLEVVIALSMLFLFVTFIISNYQKPETNLDVTNNKVSKMVISMIDSSSFRDLIASGNVAAIYNSIYDKMDISYAVRLCDWIDENCVTEGTIPSNKTVGAFDYYLYDANKTLSVITWIK